MRHKKGAMDLEDDELLLDEEEELDEDDDDEELLELKHKSVLVAALRAKVLGQMQNKS